VVGDVFSARICPFKSRIFDLLERGKKGGGGRPPEEGDLGGRSPEACVLPTTAGRGDEGRSCSGWTVTKKTVHPCLHRAGKALSSLAPAQDDFPTPTEKDREE